MKRMTVYFTDDQMAWLEALARREARPKAEIIRDAFDRYVADAGMRLPEAVGIFEDREVDSANVDDWLGAHRRPERARWAPRASSCPPATVQRSTAWIWTNG